MSHTHETPGVARETREIREDTGSGIGMVVGVLLALALAGIMLWFLFGSNAIDTTPGTTPVNPPADVNPGVNPNQGAPLNPGTAPR